MRLRDLFKPKWQSTDPYVRRRAVEKLTDSSILEQIAEKDASADVRLTAVRRVAKASLLATMAEGDPDDRVRCEAAGRLADQALLARIATSDRSAAVREAAVKKMTDKDALRSISHNQEERDAVRVAAGQVLGDDALAKHLKKKQEIIQEVKRLARALGNVNNIARFTPADAIAKIAEVFPEEAAVGIPALEEALTDRHNQMARAVAAYALGKIGKHAVSAIPKLESALSNEAGSMAENAMRKAIEQIRGG